MGSTCDAPGDAPSSVQAQQQPSSLRCESRPQVCIHAGTGAGPLRLRARAVGFARLKPASRRQLGAIGTLRRRKGDFTNETFAWEAEPGPKLRRGRTGPPPRDDVGSLSRHVVLTTAFPSHRVSGGWPPPIQLFPQWGIVGGAEGSEGPTPPLCDFGNHCCLSLNLPLLTAMHTGFLYLGARVNVPWGCWSIRAEQELSTEGTVTR